MTTPFAKVSCGSPVRAVMRLAKSAYWKMNSFSFDPPSTQLWLTLIELKVLTLSPQFSSTERVPTPYTCEFVLRP
jgi:hypothetical protein